MLARHKVVLVQHLRQLRGLARAGLAHDHHHLVRAHRLADPLLRVVDRQLQRRAPDLRHLVVIAGVEVGVVVTVTTAPGAAAAAGAEVIATRTRAATAVATFRAEQAPSCGGCCNRGRNVSAVVWTPRRGWWRRRMRARTRMRRRC